MCYTAFIPATNIYSEMILLISNMALERNCPLQTIRTEPKFCRFLAYMHYGHFFVFNLCDTYYSSDGIIGQYDPGMLFNQVSPHWFFLCLFHTV